MVGEALVLSGAQIVQSLVFFSAVSWYPGLELFLVASACSDVAAGVGGIVVALDQCPIINKKWARARSAQRSLQVDKVKRGAIVVAATNVLPC